MPTMVGDAEIVWRADRTGTIYASVEPIPNLFGQDYGLGTHIDLSWQS